MIVTIVIRIFGACLASHFRRGALRCDLKSLNIHSLFSKSSKRTMPRAATARRGAAQRSDDSQLKRSAAPHGAATLRRKLENKLCETGAKGQNYVLFALFGHGGT